MATRTVDKVIVKPAYTYIDYSCHYVVRRCGIVTQMFPIEVSVRGTKRNNAGAVIVGVLGDSDYTMPQKQAVAYINYKVANETGNKITAYAVEELEPQHPVKLNDNPKEWCNG